MNQGNVTVEGTLGPDGSLTLHQPIQLAPGPVRVTVEQLAPAKEATWQVLERIWVESKAFGLKPRSAEEIGATINVLRDESEEEMRALERLHCEGR